MAAPPNLNIPHSNATVEVSIIDTTGRGTVPTAMFVQETPLPGHEGMTAHIYSFIIKRNNPASPSKYDTLLFDLGTRKDLENSTQYYLDQLASMPTDTFVIEKNVSEILEENGVDLKSVGGIIWSHFHLVGSSPL